uniref:protein white-like n=1 Tax=Styela clava TaxID=7725 RepID=UPI00193A8813|nr:protein white-like [Styela clava]
MTGETIGQNAKVKNGSVEQTSFSSRDNGVRGSQRRLPNDYSNFSAKPTTETNRISRKGVRLTWKSLYVYAEPKTSAFSCLKRKKDDAPVLGKPILQNVNGIAEPGNVMAIMGSSGAGKSTLLNALTWRNRQNLIIKGEIKVNGRELEEQITNVSAYVQQDDLFVGAMTVREHLLFSARLRMDSSVSENERLSRVNEVMDQMGLRKCENTMIGTPGKTKTISGGEMKRLSFAAELLTNPPLLFCDEPTSGLDSYLAKVLVECLQRIAKEGCTVLCTIHQPSSEVFALFDHVLLLALGNMIYLGPREEANQYYASVGLPCPINFNPADHFIMEISVIPGMEASCKEKIAELAEHYKNSDNSRTIARMIEKDFGNPDDHHEIHIKSSPYKTGQFNQFLACLGRAMITIYRDPVVSRVRLGQTIVVALIIGLVYLRTPFGKPYDTSEVRNISGALFLVAINLTFSYVFGVINAFPTEIPLFRREHFNGMYSTAAYFFSKNVAELPMYIILPLIYSVIVYFMLGLYPGAAEFFVFYGICLLLVSTCVSFGYLISCMSPTVTVALAIGPPLIMPLLLFGGFFLSADSIPVYFVWLKYLSWFLYTNEMLTINQWQNVGNLTCPSTGENSTSCTQETGLMIIEEFDFHPENMYRDVGLMFALLVGYRTLGFLILLFRMRDSTR